jgi:hypothetical protein
VIGPLREEQSDYLRTVTFFVNPDQLSLLMAGAEYHNADDDNYEFFGPQHEEHPETLRIMSHEHVEKNRGKVHDTGW